MLNVWCKRGEVLVAWRCMVQGHHLKLLPTEEDKRPKVLIRGEWRNVPDGYPADASSQLERDQLFINDCPSS